MGQRERSLENNCLSNGRAIAAAGRRDATQNSFAKIGKHALNVLKIPRAPMEFRPLKLVVTRIFFTYLFGEAEPGTILAE